MAREGKAGLRGTVARTVRWIARIIVALLCIVAGILVAFRLEASRRETKTRAEAAPNTGRFVGAAGTEIFVQEDGPMSGPAVLLVHGTGAWSEIWRQTIAALAKNGFRAVAMDLPPFGYSEKPTGPAAYSRQYQARRIIGVLDALGIQQATLVGHSVGGRPTIEAALDAPTRIRNLVLVDPALGFAADRGDGGASFEQNNPSWALRTVFAVRPARNAFLSAYATNPFFTKKLFASFVSNTACVTEERVRMLQLPLVVQYSTNAYGDWMSDVFIAQDTSAGAHFENFKNLRMAVYLIWGSTDTVTPLWQGEQLKKLIPKAELSVMSGVGHIPFIEDAGRFNEILLSWLAGHEPLSGRE